MSTQMCSDPPVTVEPNIQILPFRRTSPFAKVLAPWWRIVGEWIFEAGISPVRIHRRWTANHDDRLQYAVVLGKSLQTTKWTVLIRQWWLRVGKRGVDWERKYAKSSQIVHRGKFAFCFYWFRYGFLVSNWHVWGSYFFFKPTPYKVMYNYFVLEINI